MKTQVYALHIAYNGYEDKIWRTVEVSSKYTLAQLGYLILHTFDTLAYHAFEFSFKDTPYVLPMILEESDIENAIDATQAKLQDLNLAIGDTMETQIAIASCNSFQKRNKSRQSALAPGGRGEAPSGGSQRRAAPEAVSGASYGEVMRRRCGRGSVRKAPPEWRNRGFSSAGR